MKLQISNSDQHRPLIGCKVYVIDIAPHEYDGPWLLKEGFSLAAGDHEFVPLASYKEPDNINISAYGDTFLEILATKSRPKPSSKVQHVLTIRATALGSPFCEIKCKLWVDDTGRLRIGMPHSPVNTSDVTRAAENKLSADVVYEKRYAVLQSIRALLNELAGNLLMSDEKLRIARRNADDASLLFDEDLAAYVKEISRRASIAQSITRTLPSLAPGKDKVNAVNQAAIHREWLLAQGDVLTERFRSVLQLK